MRGSILEFLQWNDTNGCYTNKFCIAQGIQPLTFTESIQSFCHVLSESDLAYYEMNVTEIFHSMPEIKHAFMKVINNVPYETIINDL